MTKLEHHRIVEIKENSPFENRFYELFKTSISDQVPLSDFRKLFSKYTKMDAYIMKNNDKDIGLAYFMTCRNPENTKDVYIRLGFGIIEEERERSYFPKGLIMKTMIMAKLQNLFRNVYMVGITMNPIVYSATCKYWKYSYPSPLLPFSKSIEAVKTRIINRFNLNEESSDVISVPFNITEIAEIKNKLSINGSDNPYIQFFNSKIAETSYNQGLLSIVPIDFKNLGIVVIRKTKMDVMRSIYTFFDEKVMPALREYKPARN